MSSVDVGEAQDVGSSGRRRGAAARGARVQLLERERLDQVVVGTGVEPRHAVADGVAGGQHQDRRAVAGRPQAPAHLEAVDAGISTSSMTASGARSETRLERLGPVGRELDVVALQPQGPLERRANGRLVVHDENAHGESVPAEPVCR